MTAMTRPRTRARYTTADRVRLTWSCLVLVWWAAVPVAAFIAVPGTVTTAEQVTLWTLFGVLTPLSLLAPWIAAGDPPYDPRRNPCPEPARRSPR